MGKRSKCEDSTLTNPNLETRQKSKRKSTTIAATVVTEDKTEENHPKEKRVKKKKHSLVKNEPMVQNKKNIFQDDTPVEIKLEKEVTSKCKRTNKKTQSASDDESQVKDEDIDAFCDELDEEDNVQFDNWVKLLEQKLGPNKHK